MITHFINDTISTYCSVFYAEQFAFFMRFGMIFLVGKFAYIITFSYICSVKKSINQPIKIEEYGNN